MKFLWVAFVLWAWIPSQAQVTSGEHTLPPRHAVYLHNFVVIPIVAYDARILTFGPSDAVLMRIGTMHTYGISWYHGGSRQGYELGVLSWDLQGVAIEGFYRYTAANGLLLKAGVSYVPEEEAIPTVAIGYTF